MRRARPSLRGRAPAPGLGEPQLRQQARRDGGLLGGGENDVLNDRVMFDAMAISVRAVGRGVAVGRRRRGGVGRGRLPTRRRVWRIGFFRRAHRRRHGRARDQNQPTGDGGVHGADLIALRQRRSRPGPFAARSTARTEAIPSASPARAQPRESPRRREHAATAAGRRQSRPARTATRRPRQPWSRSGRRERRAGRAAPPAPAGRTRCPRRAQSPR